ncbi:hypothetical protein CBS9595_003636 [Malassezia furfur]|nr:hypothetical protein CBS9595_003636 [Malassezia furfur]
MMPAHAYASGGPGAYVPDMAEREWDAPRSFFPRSLRRVASGDVALLAAHSADAAAPTARTYSPLDVRDVPSGGASPAEERPLSRTASRILRISRSFSRLGERKSSAGSSSAHQTPALVGHTPRSTTPTLAAPSGTMRMRSDSNPSVHASTRWRTRTALLAARDSPDVAGSHTDELGNVSPYTQSPVWPETDAWHAARRSATSPAMRAAALADAPGRLPYDAPPPDAPWTEAPRAASPLLPAASVSSTALPGQAGLGLAIDGMRLAPPETSAWTGAEDEISGPGPASPRRSRARGLASSLLPAKRREKPLPPLQGEATPPPPSLPPPGDETRRSHTNLRRLFRAGAGDDDEPRRPMGFRRRRSDLRLGSGGEAPRTSPVLPRAASPPPPSRVPPPAVSLSTSSSASSALLPPESLARADTPATSQSDAQSDLERKQSVQRYNVLKELAETECTYAADLAVVRELYLARARLYAGIRTPTASMLAPSPHIAPGASPTEGAHATLPRSRSSRSMDSLEVRHLDAALHHPLSPKKRREQARGSAPSVASEHDDEGPSWAHPERTPHSPRPERVRPSSPVRAPPLSVPDILVIFAGLEPCAALAGEMSTLLSASVHEHDAQAVGYIFLQKMAQIEQVYTLYCGRHEAAMARLSEVTAKSPAAAAFLAECDATSREHSRAWDLPSLLIKPVQRVLKYPLFLRSVVDCTPPTHFAHPVLYEALQQIQHVADRINENKKRIEIVERHGFAPLQPPRPAAFRRPPAALRMGKSSPKLGGQPLTADEGAYRAWVERLDASERGLLRFAEQCGSWAQCVRTLYATQLRVADEWIAVYRTDIAAGEQSAVDRLLEYRTLVEHTFLDTVCARLDAELRRTVTATTHAVHRLLERPRMVMANRAAKEHEYRKYLADLARRPHTQPGSGARAFLSMHVQLMEELPALIRGIALLLDRCIMFFAEIQTTYYGVVVDELRAFCARHFPSILSPNSASTPTAGTNPLLTPVEPHPEPLLDALTSALVAGNPEAAPRPPAALRPATPLGAERAAATAPTRPTEPPQRPTRSEARTHATAPRPKPPPLAPLEVSPTTTFWAPETPLTPRSTTSSAAPRTPQRSSVHHASNASIWETPRSSVTSARSYHDEAHASPDRASQRDSYRRSSPGHSLFRDARTSFSSTSGASIYRDARASTDSYADGAP